MWEMILAGRYMMIPIALASFVGMAVIIERLLVLQRGRIVYPQIAEAVETMAASPNLAVAYAICERKPGPFANIVKSGLDHADNDWTIIRDVLEEAGRQEANRLTRRLGVLETVAAVSPPAGTARYRCRYDPGVLFHFPDRAEQPRGPVFRHQRSHGHHCRRADDWYSRTGGLQLVEWSRRPDHF